MKLVPHDDSEAPHVARVVPAPETPDGAADDQSSSLSVSRRENRPIVLGLRDRPGRSLESVCSRLTKRLEWQNL